MVANEDGRVLLGIRPVLQPESNTKENLVPTDKHVAYYRAKVKEFEALGWRIDQREIERNKLRVAYAIPSPARRNSKNWTLDPVPLVSAKKGARAKIAIVE
jgi:hypothetical protein